MCINKNFNARSSTKQNNTITSLSFHICSFHFPIQNDSLLQSILLHNSFKSIPIKILWNATKWITLVRMNRWYLFCELRQFFFRQREKVERRRRQRRRCNGWSSEKRVRKSLVWKYLKIVVSQQICALFIAFVSFSSTFLFRFFFSSVLCTLVLWNG